MSVSLVCHLGLADFIPCLPKWPEILVTMINAYKRISKLLKWKNVKNSFLNLLLTTLTKESTVCYEPYTISF